MPLENIQRRLQVCKEKVSKWLSHSHAPCDFTLVEGVLTQRNSRIMPMSRMDVLKNQNLMKKFACNLQVVSTESLKFK